VSHDPYTDAIKAAAAAITAPYRDPETVIAFVDAFPMLAAARALNAALPHLRETLLAEQIPAGPCPATHVIPLLDPAGNPKPLHALCDLRAGHVGQHEAEDKQWGHFRWSDTPSPASSSECRCPSLHMVRGSHLWCTLTSGHDNMHLAYVGDDEWTW